MKILNEIGTDMPPGSRPGASGLPAWFAPGLSASAGCPTGNAASGKGIATWPAYSARPPSEPPAPNLPRRGLPTHRPPPRHEEDHRRDRLLILVIICAPLSGTHAQFVDFGPDYYASRSNRERNARHDVRELKPSATPSLASPEPDPGSVAFVGAAF